MITAQLSRFDLPRRLCIFVSKHKPMKRFFFGLFFFFLFNISFAQNYWQQYAKYEMDVDVDVTNHTYHGKQRLTYVNRSPDTLHEFYYHLYWNAFRPGSAMYWHNHTRKDPDKRLEKLAKLKPDEIGRYTIRSLRQDGRDADYQITGTVMRVRLNKPLAPGDTTVFDMDYTVQIPKLIRRSGYDNAEGIALSMAQWYPKAAEYRPDGWHVRPFLGREFFGVWGDFDVRIHIDSRYTVAASGYLKNPNEVKTANFPPANRKKRRLRKGQKLTWHFVAPQVHDFSWAADSKYRHDTLRTDSGVVLHFYYVPSSKTVQRNWDSLKVYAARALAYYNKIIGPYPYRKYSIIQAGDGGMEYAMGTFILGKRKLGSLVGTTLHEMAHSWFQFVLATDENRYPWMDEGFTTFVSTMAMHDLWYKPRGEDKWITQGMLESYIPYAGSDYEEPASLFSDFYDSHAAYWVNAYDKGALFLAGIFHIAGPEAAFRFLQNYYRHWQFKHPGPADILREAERAAGMELDWYYDYWINGTKHIDYAIDTVEARGNKTLIRIRNRGTMPMPVDVAVKTGDGQLHIWHIPFFRTLHYRQGPLFIQPAEFHTLKPWYDGFPTYAFEIPLPKDRIRLIFLNPDMLAPDVDWQNNQWTPQP